MRVNQIIEYNLTDPEAHDLWLVKSISTDFAQNPSDPIPVGAIEFGKSYTITKGQKFAQMRLVEVPRASYYTVDNINTIDSDRGAGGFGSSDLETGEVINEIITNEINGKNNN